MDKEKPIIAIYQGDRPTVFRVLINGKEIPDLRSFEIRIDNSLEKQGICEMPYCKVEQYLLWEP